MTGGARIRQLATVDEVRMLGGLLDEYIRFVCDDLEGLAGIVYDPEVLLRNTLNSLGKVVPPNGRTFIAEDPVGGLLGMVFLRHSGPGAMEIKRLYVRPAARGTGAGRTLVGHAIEAARGEGARSLRLDTSRGFEAAIALYRSMGFVDRGPYPESDHFDDAVLAPVLVFMEKPLG